MLRGFFYLNPPRPKLPRRPKVIEPPWIEEKKFANVVWTSGRWRWRRRRSSTRGATYLHTKRALDPVYSC